jgi:hypothetical protein
VASVQPATSAISLADLGLLDREETMYKQAATKEMVDFPVNVPRSVALLATCLMMSHLTYHTHNQCSFLYIRRQIQK